MYKKIQVYPLFYVSVKLGLILRVEHWQRAFENGVLRKIFGPRRLQVRRIGKK